MKRVAYWLRLAVAVPLCVAGLWIEDLGDWLVHLAMRIEGEEPL